MPALLLDAYAMQSIELLWRAYDVYRSPPELQNVRLQLQSYNTSQSCKLQLAKHGILSNPPSCGLTLQHSFPYCIIYTAQH